MKKILLSTVSVLLLVTICFPQTSMLLLNENFTGLSSAGLGPSNGQWVNANTNAFVQVNTASPLANPNYTSGGQYVTITNINSADDPYKNFNSSQSIPTTANTVVYMSFLVRVDNASETVSAGSNAQTVLALGNNGSNDRLGFFIGNSGSGTNNLKFGIKKNGTNGSTFASGNYAFGATHLVIIKYVYVNGSNNDLMYMWIDPAISPYSELQESSASLAINSGNDNNLSLNSVGFVESNNGAIASFDALHVAYATNWGSLAANSLSSWTALFSGGQSLPVKFGMIKATGLKNMIRVEWDVYSEENISAYEIERSGDGRSFDKIGSTNAFNNLAERKKYDYKDIQPLEGNNFYRIRSIDKDGKELLSTIVKVNRSNKETPSFSLYPNPSQNASLSIQLNNFSGLAYDVQILNMAGNVVYKTEIRPAGIATTQNYPLRTTLNSGHYAVLVNGNGVKLSGSLIIL